MSSNGSAALLVLLETILNLELRFETVYFVDADVFQKYVFKEVFNFGIKILRKIFTSKYYFFLL